MINLEKWKIWLIAIITFFGVVYTLPNIWSTSFNQTVIEDFPSWFPSSTVSLGLDLQGGSHLLLEADLDAVISERVESIVATARTLSRKASVRPRGLRKTKDGVTFVVENEEGRDRLVRALRRDLGEQINILEDASGRVDVQYTEQALNQIKSQTIQQSIEIIRRRVDETGTREPLIQAQGEDRILVQLPGVENPERIKELLGKTARMTFHLVDMEASCQTGSVSAGSRCVPFAEEGQGQIPIRRRALLTGEMLVDSQPSFGQSGEPVVSFRFDSIGARKFGDVTEDNVGKLFAIVLDNEVITAPRINEPILGGSGQISGSFSPEGANDLAILLRAGALPAPLTVVEERSVGPSLGADSIEAGKIAGLIGLVGIIFFMGLFYGRFGLYADLALIANMFLIIALLSVLGATLTLPGIAGIVLTIGMAVDANVLIFERIREEVRAGRSPVAAIDKGYQGAMSTIVDASVTTLIAAFLLYILGTGPVRGFAVTLTIGIVTSMFSAIYLTRLFIILWLRRNRPSSLNI